MICYTQTHTAEEKASTMAPSYNRQHFLTTTIRLSAVAWIISWVTDVTGSATPKHLKAEIGGNMTFKCFDEDKSSITFFYFQINSSFINGYYEHDESREYFVPWNNTKLDGKTVHMYNLNVSHRGLYECIMKPKNGNDIRHEFYYLSVTANFSEPTVTISCEEGSSCFVTCASHGGYPGAPMIINVPVSKNTSGQMWKVVNSSQMSNPITMTYNSTRTAVFNCSTGVLTHISCSVGEVTSSMFSVCEQHPVVDVSFNHTIVIIASCAVVVVIVVTGFLLYCQWKKRKQHRQTRRVSNAQQMENLRGGAEADEGHLA